MPLHFGFFRYICFSFPIYFSPFHNEDKRLRARRVVYLVVVLVMLMEMGVKIEI